MSASPRAGSRQIHIDRYHATESLLPTDAGQAEALERARLLFTQMPFVILSGVLVPAFVVFWQWSKVPHAPMLLWAACLGAVALWRFWAWHRFWTDEDSVRLRKVDAFAISALLTGGAWALASVFAFGVSSESDRWLLLALLAGIGAGAAVSLAAHFRAFAGFFAPPMLAFAVQSLLQFTSRDVGVGTLVLIFTAAMLFFARNISKALGEAIRMRIANGALLREQIAQHDRLQLALQAKQRFLAGVSHDLRQPVQAFTLLMQSVIEERDAGRQQAHLRRVAQAATQLRDMVAKLLESSYLDLSEAAPSPRWIDPAHIFGVIQDASAVHAARRGVSVRFRAPAAEMWADPMLLQRILQNLVENAIEHAEATRILVGCRRSAEAIELRVYDNGKGIALHHQSRVFEERYTVPVNPDGPGAGRDHQSLGLGLAICRHLAELAGYRLGLKSAEGDGSCFWLTVPRWRPKARDMVSQAETAAPAGELAAARPTAPPRLATVLLIEDDRLVMFALAVTLENAGYDVIKAASSREALEQLLSGAQRPDIIVSDWALSEEETALGAIRTVQNAVGSRIPVIIVTGQMQAEALAAPHALQALEVRQILSKPIVEKQLLSAVADNLPELATRAERASPSPDC